MSVPNALSALRIVLVPVLLALAFLGHGRLFTVVLVVSFATDVLDGFLARRLGQVSELGAKLDSWGDFAVYASMPVCAWWLIPDAFALYFWYFVAAAASVFVPPLVAFAKFHHTSSYHTLAVKLAAALVGGSLVVLFAGGPAWPFLASVPVSVLAGVEEVAITCALRAPRSNVRSLWHALRAR